MTEISTEPKESNNKLDEEFEIEKAIKKINPKIVYVFMLVALAILLYIAYLMFLTNNDPVAMAEKLGYTCNVLQGNVYQ